MSNQQDVQDWISKTIAQNDVVPAGVTVGDRCLLAARPRH